MNAKSVVSSPIRPSWSARTPTAIAEIITARFFNGRGSLSANITHDELVMLLEFAASEARREELSPHEA